MTKAHVTKTAEIRALEPYEDANLPLFEAPFDGLIANVAFTPSEDLRGAYYTRQLQLNVNRDGGQHMVGDIQLGSDEILLPGGEMHNAQLHFPPISLRVREGDALSWSSIGSVGEGLAVPAGQVEVLFERKEIAEDTSPSELWAQCVPDCWIGKKVWLEYHDKDVYSLMRKGGSFSSTAHEYVGTFQGADTDILKIAIDPLEQASSREMRGSAGAKSQR